MVVDPDEVVKTFTPAMTHVVYQWCSGVTFGELCKLTDIFEGAAGSALVAYPLLIHHRTDAVVSLSKTVDISVPHLIIYYHLVPLFLWKFCAVVQVQSFVVFVDLRSFSVNCRWRPSPSGTPNSKTSSSRVLR